MTRVRHTADYAEKRRAEYPSVEEQLEALIEGGQKLADLKAWIAAVKSKYPKPEVQTGPR